MPAQQQLDMLTVVAALNTGNARRTSLSNATKRGSSVGIMCIVVALAAAPSQRRLGGIREEAFRAADLARARIDARDRLAERDNCLSLAVTRGRKLACPSLG